MALQSLKVTCNVFWERTGLDTISNIVNGTGAANDGSLIISSAQQDPFAIAFQAAKVIHQSGKLGAAARRASEEPPYADEGVFEYLMGQFFD